MVSVVKALGPMILRMAKEEKKNEESRKNYISITMQYNTKRIQSSIQYSSKYIQKYIYTFSYYTKMLTIKTIFCST